MENPTQPTSEGTKPTHNPTDREAFGMIRSLISEGHETNHERSKFAHDADEREAVENESKALDRLNAWLNAKEAKGDAPDLSAVPLDALIIELFRRERAGECLALVVTPNDLTEYWEVDESGSTHPGSRVPEAEEMHAIKKAFHRWQDNGAHSEMMEWLRDAWQAAQANQLDQEGGAR